MRNNPPDTDLLARGSAAGAQRQDFSTAYTMFIDFTVVVGTFQWMSKLHQSHLIDADVMPDPPTPWPPTHSCSW